jgi:large subunit ribosomal protein L26e
MKFNKRVSSSRRKNRRRHFNAPSHIRQKIMCAPLSKSLCREYGVPRLTVPLHRDDEVKVVRGKFKEDPPSKIVTVNRRRYRLYLENITRDKTNSVQVKVPIHYSNVVITKLKLDSFRKDLIARRVKKKLSARKHLGLDPSGAKKAKKEAAAADLD